MRNWIGHAVVRYLITISLVLLVILAKSFTDYLWGDGSPLILFISAVMFAARFCGWDAGILATCLSTMSCLYFYFEPTGSLLVHSTNDAFRVGVFLVEGFTLSTLMYSLQAARRRAEQTTRLLILKEQAVRETEEKLQLLIDSVQDYAIIMLDPTGHIISWNSGAERIKGYRAEEILGRHFSCFFRAEDLVEGQLDELLKTVASGQRVVEEGWRVRKDGSTYWANSIFSAVFNETGQLKGFAKVTRDVTARRLADEERRLAAEESTKARDKALEASRAKSEFLANMSHEIRTPMNGVLGMTELVLDSDLTREQRDSMELVKSSAESLLVVINEILDFSKIEAGKVELDPVEFELHDLIEDTLKSLALRAHYKGLEITGDIETNVPRDVVGDPHRIRQILINLLGNAIKFTDNGEITLRAWVQNQTEETCRISISVTDTGVGIPADKQQAIFDPFSQADGSATRRHCGTGLGLTIASRLVELMGGRLEVESKIGLGSRFHFTIDLLKSSSAAANLNHTAVDLKGLHVLVVDDNATNRRIFDGTLRNWGAVPTTVESGPDAILELTRARKAGTPYPLLLVDAMMPEMDGFMLVERIRSDRSSSSPAIMMLTSADQQGDATRCRQLGLASYLVKPIKSLDLRNAITTVLALQSTANQAESYTDVTKKAPVNSPLSGVSFNILLAEDNPVNQQVAVRLLEKAGHRVTIAEDGRQACTLAVAGSFDVILMDVQMPEMDGFEATEAIRTAEAITGKHTPIIAMTAHAMKGDRERCLGAGMDDYLSKPIHSADLKRVLGRLQTETDQALASRVVTLSRPNDCAYDRARALANFADDEDLLAEIITLFLDSLAPRLGEIRSAIDVANCTALYRSAHSLRGAASNLAAEDFTSITLRLEECADQQNTQGAADALAELEQEAARLAIELSADPALKTCAEVVR